MDNILPTKPDLITIGKDFDICSRDSNPSVFPISSQPFGLPPVIRPKFQNDLEELLSHPEDLPLYKLSRVQRFINGELLTKSMFEVAIQPPRTTLEVQRDLATGKVLSFKETSSKISGCTASNSVSRLRHPCTPKDALMGGSSNLPFLPAGFQSPKPDISPTMKLPWDTGPILRTPPQFNNGFTFPNVSNRSLTSTELSAILQLLRNEHWLAQPSLNNSALSSTEVNPESDLRSKHLLPEVDTLVEEVNVFLNRKDVVPTVLTISTEPSTIKPKHYEWAVEVPINQPVPDLHKLIPNMAKEWPFELDPFQKHAIINIEKNHNVFVAAHTSAGKTVVAEYAIALALKHNTRVIYTSPVKALSNQKYHDFKQTFNDVGLLTGDIQINEKAACLIMTTEILRSMLYRGAETVRELEWVIFDEVHYINDPERGVVWEEVFIMLPDCVRLVMLSATVSNILDLADWVGRTKRSKIFVMSTSKRPVPLEHYLYTGSAGKTQDELFKLIDANSAFLDGNYTKAKTVKEDRAANFSKTSGPVGSRHYVSPQQDRNIYQGILNYLKKQDNLPVICFTLSRKRCNQNADLLRGVELLNKAEQAEVHRFFWNSISTLKPVDQKLPQIKSMALCLKRGFGVHHSGILPILKEIVEMLFQRGLIKVLFATETFAMGVNMPARSVVFDSIRKHDGHEFRDLNPSEYIQMAGRAGRRGLDDTGTVIILCKGDVPCPMSLRQMMLGKPPMMESRFRVTYNMVLNLLRVRQLKMEDILRRCFREVFAERRRDERMEKLQTYITELSALSSFHCEHCSPNDSLEMFWQTMQQHEEQTAFLLNKIYSSKMCSKVLCSGRIVFVNFGENRNTLAAVLAVNNAKKLVNLIILAKVNKLQRQEKEETMRKTPWKPGPNVASMHKKDTFCVEEVPLESITCITSTCISTGKKKNQRMRNELGDQAEALLPELIEFSTTRASSLKWLTFEDIEKHQVLEGVLQLEHQMKTSACTTCPQFEEHFESRYKQLEMQQSIQKVELELSTTSLLPNYQSCLKVLELLGYIDSQHILRMRGQVACELSSFELLLTELLSQNVFTDISPAECAALLSCFVFQQKGNISKDLAANLQQGILKIKIVASKIEDVQAQCGLGSDPDYRLNDNLRFGLVHVVHQWAKGISFSDITDLTDVDEGIIVRTIQRLVELMKDIRNASRIFGNDALKQKMDEAAQTIKRDIVFAPSLYIK